jgi:hypothetical protein
VFVHAQSSNPNKQTKTAIQTNPNTKKQTIQTTKQTIQTGIQTNTQTQKSAGTKLSIDTSGDSMQHKATT